MRTDLLEQAAALLADDGIQAAREVLCREILQKPDNYKARALLRESFTGRERSSGDKHCPCCGHSFAAFLPGGPSFRPDACCPACESLERHRFLCLLLSRAVPWRADAAHALHVAAEPCLRERLRAEFGGRYHTMDLLRDADFRGDLVRMPLKSASLEVIIANHVLEHVRDDRAALGEMFRVLKPLGKAFVQIPQDRRLAVTQEAPAGATPRDLLRLFGQEDHVRMYGRDFRERLEEAGFQVREQTCRDLATREEQERYGLNPQEILWEATRP